MFTLAIEMGGRTLTAAAAAAALLALAAAPPATASDVIAVQPDGRIIVAGGATPGFGMLARLDPDGSPDPGFGDGGFVIDRTSTPFTGVAIQPDGKLVVLNTYTQLRRFNADGTLDTGFGEGGTAKRPPLGILEPPEALAVLADGRIAYGGNYHVKMLTHKAIAYVVSPDGRYVDQAGEVGPEKGTDWQAGNRAGSLAALTPGPGGSLLMSGYFAPDFNSSEGGGPIFARFRPGSGEPFDPTFGGAGLVRISNPFSFLSFSALAAAGDGFVAAGAGSERIVVGRYDWEGAIDPGFGSGGFAAVMPTPKRSRANDLVVAPGGGIVVAGVADMPKRSRAGCFECGTPVLFRLSPEGGLDPAFGNGGVTLLEPGGTPLPTRAETAVSDAAGRTLLGGSLTSRRPASLVARVGSDGRLDASFGDGGIAMVDACPGDAAAQRRRGCLPAARVRLRVGRTGIRLTVRPNRSWTSITGVHLTLPKPLRAVTARRRRIRAKLVEADGDLRSVRVGVKSQLIGGYWSIGPKRVTIVAPRSALRRAPGVAGGRRLRFGLEVDFGMPFFGYSAGRQELVLRRSLGR